MSEGIRRAIAADIPACLGIVAGLPEHFTEGVGPDVRRDLEDYDGWVASSDGRPIGFLVARTDGETAEIIWAAVDARSRHGGIGTALVDAALEAFRVDGVRLVEVKTLDPSAGYAPYLATYAFWTARGFVRVDVVDPMPGWQPGNPCAILVAALAATT